MAVLNVIGSGLQLPLYYCDIPEMKNRAIKFQQLVKHRQLLIFISSPEVLLELDEMNS